MGNDTYQAMVVREADSNFTRAIESRQLGELPPNQVLIKVQYSSLNYKDALSASGNKGVTRQYPHTPGIDAAGIRVPGGEELIITGYDLGMNTSGGFGQFIRVPAEWVVPMPKGLTLREAMTYGTAGFTAAQSVWRLRELGVTPQSGEVLVTGATGGVGCMAVAILGQLRYRVVAATGKADAHAWLKEIGAAEIVGRDAVTDTSGKPLLKSRWAGVVETVGGQFLSNALRTTSHRGVVTCCGNVGGADFPMSVYPFILRGVTLCGIDSATCPMPMRREIWNNLAGEWKPKALDKLAREINLEQLNDEIDRTLKGQQQGRVVVKLWE